VGDPCPLLPDPTGELRELGQCKPLEEDTPIDLERSLDIATGQRGQEVPEIAAEEGGTQPDREGIGLDYALTQVAPSGVEGLMQGVPGPLSVALRPQVEEKLVARYPRRAPAGEDRQQREGAGAAGRPFDRLGVGFEGQAAEHSKSVPHSRLNTGLPGSAVRALV
jgi:hypothetical protein